MKKDKVFVYKQDNEEGAMIFEAKIPLPDDGVPHSEQELIIDVAVGSDTTPTITLKVSTSSGTKIKPLGSMDVHNNNALACLLYGSARLKTIEVFEAI